MFEVFVVCEQRLQVRSSYQVYQTCQSHTALFQTRNLRPYQHKLHIYLKFQQKKQQQKTSLSTFELLAIITRASQGPKIRKNKHVLTSKSVEYKNGSFSQAALTLPVSFVVGLPVSVFRRVIQPLGRSKRARTRCSRSKKITS